MRILAIETSCDDTSSSVVENGNRVLSNIISSQISVHAKYNGVVPELASREHIKNVNIVVEQALQQAKIPFEKFDKEIVDEGINEVNRLNLKYQQEYNQNDITNSAAQRQQPLSAAVFLRKFTFFLLQMKFLLQIFTSP